MGLKEKFADYNRRKMAEDPGERFVRQVKGSFLSTAVIIGIVFALIVVFIIINAVSSIF